MPGFTQTAASWDGVVGALHDLDPTIDARPVDVPGDVPGDIDVDGDVDLDFEATARALGAEHGRATWCGYSMGARLVLRLAIDAPDRVSRLVLVSATAGIDDPAARAARVASDATLAATIERDGVDRFLDRWLARPMFAGVPRDAPGLDERRALTAAHLAGQLRRLGTGAMTPLWDRLPELGMPVLVVHGAHDTKFSAFADRLVATVPRAERIALDCGHAVPLEQPRALAAALHAFHNPTATSTASTS